jgi:N-acetylneuraminate synthase
MVDQIRNTERALGSARPQVLDIETELHDIARRHVHAVTSIEEGETLTEENIAVLRSGDREPGTHPRYFETLVGRSATRKIEQGAGIAWEDVTGEDPTE